ncbi:MAG TPA: transcriptional regulator [Planctomycetota bacterium]|nr:transcriptional regulator [Planctomycetota bacterium]
MKHTSRDKDHALPSLRDKHGDAKQASKAVARAAAAPSAVQLDPVIHERTRLAILTALFTLPSNACSFLDLRDTLSLTDGNLMAHLRTLESAGLIEREKEGAGRKSSTTVQLSASGKREFKAYLDSLESLVRAARGTA